MAISHSLKRTARKGFSLVELLVVVTIIAILSVVAYTAVGGQTAKARDAKRKQDLATIQQALEIMKADQSTTGGYYPKAFDASGTAATDGSIGQLMNGAGAGQISKKYLSDIPNDPDGTPYKYILKVGGDAYTLMAALEGDGTNSATTGMRAYVVGNNDTAPTMTNALFVGANPPNPLTTVCNNTVTISNKPVCTVNTANTPTSCSCLPYDPRP